MNSLSESTNEVNRQNEMNALVKEGQRNKRAWDAIIAEDMAAAHEHYWWFDPEQRAYYCNCGAFSEVRS